MRQQRLNIYRTECLPQTFTSAKQTDNYDSDDSVAYEERFIAITALITEKHLKSLSLSIDETSTQLTLLCIVKRLKVKPKVDLQNNN